MIVVLRVSGGVSKCFLLVKKKGFDEERCWRRTAISWAVVVVWCGVERALCLDLAGWRGRKSQALVLSERDGLSQDKSELLKWVCVRKTPSSPSLHSCPCDSKGVSLPQLDEILDNATQICNDCSRHLTQISVQVQPRESGDIAPTSSNATILLPNLKSIMGQRKTIHGMHCVGTPARPHGDSDSFAVRHSL